MLIFYQSANAQNTIKGTITDQNNEALVGALIYLIELNKATLSNDKGEYEFENLPAGKLKIKFSFVGCENKIETIFLNQSEIELNIILQQTAIETEEIVVSGGYNSTQHENAVKIDILKINSVQNLSTPNFTEMLTKVPGVDMISKGSGVSKPVIRGLSMNDILVLNNGVRFENYQYSDHHPLGIDEFGIEDVEIIKGPASLLYGSDAIGGVINFIKEKPAPIGKLIGDYNLQLFSNSLGITNNLGIKGTSKKFFGGIRIGQKSNADYLQGGGDFVPNTRFNENSFKTNAGFTGKFGIFKLFYDYNQQKLGLAEDEPVEIITERARENTIYYQQFNNHLISSQNKIFLKSFKLELNSSFQNTGLAHIAQENFTEIEMLLQTLCYETKLYFPSSKNSEYIIGVQVFNQINTNLNNRETKLLPNANTDNYSAFGLLQYTFFEKLKIQSGLRYDYKQISTKAIGEPSESNYKEPINKYFDSFSGSIGATYNLSEKLLLRTNFAAAYRTPNLAELTSNGQHETRYEIGNHDLVPENAYETDLSIHYHTDNFTFDIAGFYNNIDNYIFISPTGDTTATGISIYRYFQTNALLLGYEAGIHLHPKHIEWLHFETTYAVVNGEKQNGDYLPFIPANKLNFEISAGKEKLGTFENSYIKLNSATAFEQNRFAYQESKTNGYTLFDFGIGADFKIKHQVLSIGFAINNMFDKKYIDHLSTLKEVNYFNPGRNISLSIKVPFYL